MRIVISKHSQTRIGFQLGACLLTGVLFFGCATTPVKEGGEAGEDLAQETQAPPAIEIPAISESAKTLMVSTKFFETEFSGESPFHDEREQLKIRVVSSKGGAEFFNPHRKGMDILSAPSMVVRPGQKGTIEIGREFIYPTAMTADLKTGDPIPEAFETVMTGVSLDVAVEATSDPDFLKVKLEPTIREFVEFLPSEANSDLKEPQFRTLGTPYAGRFQNGSYLFVGVKSDTRSIEDKVPILGDIPLLGKAFRSKAEIEIERLIAVQLIVSETTSD